MITNEKDSTIKVIKEDGKFKVQANHDMLLPEEVSQCLRVTLQTIYNYIKSGKLKSTKHSHNSIRIHINDFEEFLNE